jgi:hypothetical protein
VPPGVDVSLGSAVRVAGVWVTTVGGAVVPPGVPVGSAALVFVGTDVRDSAASVGVADGLEVGNEVGNEVGVSPAAVGVAVGGMVVG